jgi:hypothetical protein
VMAFLQRNKGHPITRSDDKYGSSDRYQRRNNLDVSAAEISAIEWHRKVVNKEIYKLFITTI